MNLTTLTQQGTGILEGRKAKAIISGHFGSLYTEDETEHNYHCSYSFHPLHTMLSVTLHIWTDHLSFWRNHMQGLFYKQSLLQ